MGVLADWQIKDEGIITPFTDCQRMPGVITSGVSSYGYDVRTGPIFQVFSNVMVADGVIDPKNFDPRLLAEIDTRKPVDDKGTIRNYCLIPPNSFALCYTVEQIRVPRDCIGVVLGKSTYARCFTGDTRVALVDGTSASFVEMAEREKAGEMFWGYGINSLGRIAVVKLEASRRIGTERVVAVRLDNGETIRCTPEHRFATRDGRWCEAGSLSAGDSLMPLYRTLVRGYEAVYQPLNGFLYPTHRLADEWNLGMGVYEDEAGTHRHHKDHVRTNNNPWNIERMEAAAHIRHHNAETFGEDFDPSEHGESIRAALLRLSQDEEWSRRYSRIQSERSLAFWHSPEYAAAREAWAAQREQASPATRAKMSESHKRRYESQSARLAQSEATKKAWAGNDARRVAQSALLSKLKTRHHLSDDVVLAALHQTGSIRGAAKLLGCDRSVFRNYPNAVEAFRAGMLLNNHKVVAVDAVTGEHDVYCLTAPGFGNFALESGVFVANCGLIVNCTPLEPEWYGNVTIEVSNTTTLPAKVYANEGIAQILFLRADGVLQGVIAEAMRGLMPAGETAEERATEWAAVIRPYLCRTSYADKDGRYQGQGARVIMPCVRVESG